MKKTMVALGVLACAASVFAAPLSFSENWDSYAIGADDASYNSTWSTLGVKRHVITNSGEPTQLSASNRLLVDNGSSYSDDMGISHDFGETVVPTADSPIVVDFYLWCDSAGNRDDIDVFVELALNDQAPLTSGEAHNVVALAMPYSVRGLTDKRARLFDGLNWADSGLAPTADSWDHMSMTIYPDHIDLATNAASNSNLAINYTGGFDQINIRHPKASSAGAAWLDNLSVTGGAPIPEPATLILLGLGGLFLRRRTR